MKRQKLLGILIICVMLSAPLTARAEPEPETWVNPFSDVFAGDWFYGDIEYAYTRGMINGTSTEPMMFSPDMPLSRGMLVTILYRAADSPALTGHINPFDDISGGEWFADAVIWAATNGIAAGYDGGFFPNDSITRQDFALILWRFGAYIGKGVTASADLSGFADAGDVALYAVNAMQYVVAAGVVTGRPDGTLDPGGNAKRSEASAMLHRFMVFVG